MTTSSIELCPLCQLIDNRIKYLHLWSSNLVVLKCFYWIIFGFGEIGPFPSQISKKVQFIPRPWSPELSSIFGPGGKAGRHVSLPPKKKLCLLILMFLFNLFLQSTYFLASIFRHQFLLIRLGLTKDCSPFPLFLLGIKI